MNIQYLNEHLGVSTLGHILVLVAFVAVSFSALSYFFSAQNNSDSYWKKIGKWFFRIHSGSVLLLVGLLFYMLLNHMYEYLYIFKHSNDVMPLKYILSCFWAGQEGSFLLWVICHVILGNILQLTAKKWEAHVMTIYAVVQGFLVSMLLGITIPSGVGVGLLLGVLLVIPFLLFLKKFTLLELLSYFGAILIITVLFISMDFDSLTIGSNPFVLLTRDAESYAKELLFSQADDQGRNFYIGSIEGQGLNPLLQNYWMTIHPPTLFIGFASTLIPFCYAIAGLWTKKLNEWMEPVLPWIFFGIMILGTGILMGGAWAYESLTFGGFWAWDPVENASLFPWLTFVGAAHVMMIQKKKGEASYITFLLTIFSFLFVVFSTYLTRSGVLSETSVHSFASGASGQILFFLFFVYWLGGMVLLQKRIMRILFSAAAAALFWLNLTFGNIYWVNICFVGVLLVLFITDYAVNFEKGTSKEDNFTSREFWMFMGAVLLLLSCFQLIFKTSIPVINEVFGLEKVLQKTEILTDYAIPQMIIATFICFVLGMSLFLKYKKTPQKGFLKYILIAFISSVLVALSGMYFTDFDFGANSTTKILYPIFFIASLFAVISNLMYFLIVLKGRFKNAGSSIAHFGFGLILLGSFISTSQSEVVSKNTSDSDLEKESGGELLNAENLKVELGDTLPLGKYWVVYKNKFQEGVNVFYNVEYYQESTNGKELAFTLTPFIQTNKTFGRVAEPDTRHYLLNDLYTHLTSAISDTTTNDKKEFEPFKELLFKRTENNEYLGYTFNYESVKSLKTAENADSLVLQLDVTTPEGKMGSVEFPMVLYKDKLYPIPHANYDLGIAGEWRQVDKDKDGFKLLLSVVRPKTKDFIVLKAINFPMINLLWLGCVIMVIGTLMSIVRRIKNRHKAIK